MSTRKPLTQEYLEKKRVRTIGRYFRRMIVNSILIMLGLFLFSLLFRDLAGITAIVALVLLGWTALHALVGMLRA